MCHGQELDYIAIKVRICHGVNIPSKLLESHGGMMKCSSPFLGPGTILVQCSLKTTGMSGVITHGAPIHNGSSMEIPSGKFSRYGKQQKYGFS